MKTEFIKADLNQKDEKYQDLLKRAGELIRKGGLVAFPTETVYGLGANALDEKASASIYQAKGRPSDNPLIVHIADICDLSNLAAFISENAKKLINAYWPGPMTLVFEKKDIVPLETTGGLNTVAIRMPRHTLALDLIRSARTPVAAPSANISGRPSPTKACHVMEDLNGRIDMIIDGGETGIGIESTVIDVTAKVPIILRPGYVTGEMVEAVTGDVKTDPAVAGESAGLKPRAPGMKYHHYAPNAPMYLVKGEAAAVVKYINQKIKEHSVKGWLTGIICTEETKEVYQGGVLINIGNREDEDALGKHLFSALRELNEKGVDIIYSEFFNEEGFGQAIMNRLLKAAAYQIITV